MNELVFMPKADYMNALNAVREQTGRTELIKSGELADAITWMANNSDIVTALLHGGNLNIRNETATRLPAYFQQYTGASVCDFSAVTHIGEHAFEIAYNLDLILRADTVCTFGNYAAGSTKGIYVPSKHIDAYRERYPGKPFTTIEGSKYENINWEEQ